MNLATPECPLVSGEWQAGDALFLGSIGPHTIRQWDGSAARVDYVHRLLQAIDLGIEEWNREVPEGLFFSRRPVAMVHCNSNGDDPIAVRAMEHLVRDVDVPAVLALTDVDISAIERQALASDVTTVCVECYGRAELPPQLEAGLVWRMLPALEHQAELAAWRVNDLEARIRAERAVDESTPVRVAVWTDAGNAFVAFGDKLRELLQLNGRRGADPIGTSYLELRNVDSRYQNQPQLDFVNRLVDFAPDVVVVAINEDFTSHYLRMVESLWPSSKARPHYVATLVNQELNALAQIVANDDELRRRLSGTGLLLGEDVASNLAGFRARFRARYDGDPGRTQAGYDAWYATVLATYSADAEGRLEGGNIAAHFSQLTAGAATDVDPLALASARVYLSAQQGVDLVGTSSQLDWDPVTRRVTADTGLWCLSRDANGALQIDDDAGPRWTPEGITGSYDCP